MGLSYTGNNCLDVTIVNGYSRVGSVKILSQIHFIRQ